MKTITDFLLNRELPDLTRQFVMHIAKLLDDTHYETEGQSVSTIGRMLGDFARDKGVQANKDLTIAIRIATQIVYAEANLTKDAAQWRDSLPSLQDDEDKQRDFTYGGWLAEVVAGTATTPNGSKLDLEMMFKYLTSTITETTHPEEYGFKSDYLAQTINDESLSEDLRAKLRDAIGLTSEQVANDKDLEKTVNRIILAARKPEEKKEPPKLPESPQAAAPPEPIDLYEMPIDELIEKAKQHVAALYDREDCPSSISGRLADAAVETGNNEPVLAVKALFDFEK